MSHNEIDEMCQKAFHERDVEREKDKRSKRKDQRKRNRELRGQQAGQSRPKNIIKQRQANPRLPNIHDDYIRKLKFYCAFIEEHYDPRQHLNIARASIHLHSACGRHEQVHEAIKELDLRVLPRSWLQELKDIWDNSWYYIKSPDGLEKLNPVRMYRIRMKNPCPTKKITGKVKYNLDEKTLRLMNSLWEENQTPSRQQKLAICDDTGADIDQVTNWFKNRRQRLKNLIKKERCSSLSTEASSISVTTSATCNTTSQEPITDQEPETKPMIIPNEVEMTDHIDTMDHQEYQPCSWWNPGQNYAEQQCQLWAGPEQQQQEPSPEMYNSQYYYHDNNISDHVYDNVYGVAQMYGYGPMMSESGLLQ